ncbi:RNA 2',3'-cyclic phosphodiesterase [bacterium]|nr:RNA 2',3'-cyclic phosphodiesterase [bacterium]
MRAFLALEPAPDVRARLAAVTAELARHRAAVRWARDDQLHVTVKFLGDVEDAALDALRSALAAALAGTAPLAAEVRGLGAFPDLRRPRVLWAGVECAALAAIAPAIDAAAAAVGVAPEARPFHAHVTLGRVRDAALGRALRHEIEARAQAAFGACVFRELAAFRSDLRRDGALYTKLWSIPFGG